MPALRTNEDNVGTLPQGYVFDDDGAIVPVSGEFVSSLWELGVEHWRVVFA